jgi:hypothetical protein
MSADNPQPGEFERRVRVVLEESVAHTDARVRSRLNRARHAALEAAATPARQSIWDKFAWKAQGLMPATGAVAAALVLAIVLWGRNPQHALPMMESAQTSIEDLDLIADDEALTLMEEGDRSFYEWAVSQEDAAEGASS